MVGYNIISLKSRLKYMHAVIVEKKAYKMNFLSPLSLVDSLLSNLRRLDYETCAGYMRHKRNNSGLHYLWRCTFHDFLVFIEWIYQDFKDTYDFFHHMVLLSFFLDEKNGWNTYIYSVKNSSFWNPLLK